LDKLYCSGQLEEVHRRNDCSYTVCTEMMLQWHCLLNNVLCSPAIDCCSAFRHKLLDTERSVTSNTVTMEERIIGHSSGLCLHTASCNQLSPTVQVSVYTQLLLTSAELLHNKSIYNLLPPSYCTQSHFKLYLLRTAELQDISILLFED
jgi:hypothetical protein